MYTPLPLLLPDEIERTVSIGRAIREGRVAAFVGAGMSLAAGLPDWTALTGRLIRAWQDWDPTPGVRRLSAPNYVQLIRDTFGGNDLAFVSHLRRSLPTASRPGSEQAPPFNALLYPALYSNDYTGEFIHPVPSDIHRHLVALFAKHPGHLWTTNYDDLLEQAANEQQVNPQPLDLEQHKVRTGLLITHLHGFLPPLPPNEVTAERIGNRTVVLAEDDYHAVATGRSADHLADTGWIANEFYRLFHEHQVLMLGMSLTDPNLRRVLATLSMTSRVDPHPEAVRDSSHFAVLTPRSPDSLALSRIRARRRTWAAETATKIRADFWKSYGLTIIDLSTYERLPSFLVRLRYESGGTASGELWRQGGRQGFGRIDPWTSGQQIKARELLTQVIEGVQRQFAVPTGEIIDIGIFLIEPDQPRLELVFRAGQSSAPVRRGRVFSVEPDTPTGVAGCVFVSGVGLRTGRDHVLMDFGEPSSPTSSSAPYRGLIVAPLVDWADGGVPVGVIYATVITTGGRLFEVPEEQIVNLLADFGRTVLSALRP